MLVRPLDFEAICSQVYFFPHSSSVTVEKVFITATLFAANFFCYNYVSIGQICIK